MKYTIRNERERETALSDLRAASLPARMELTSGSRTLTQNASLHVFLERLAETLNAAGYDMRRVLKPEAEIPWTKEAAKEHLWKPIQEAITGNASTADAATPDYAEVEMALARHLSAKLGIQCPPWPKKDDA